MYKKEPQITKNENKKKINWGWFSVNALMVFLILLPVIELIYGYSRPEHTIRVKYTIYDNPVRHEIGTYSIKGSDFRVRQYIEYRRYTFGGNTVCIQDGHPFIGYVGNQSVCIYNGMHDVRVNKVEIIK